MLWEGYQGFPGCEIPGVCVGTSTLVCGVVNLCQGCQKCSSAEELRAGTAGPGFGAAVKCYKPHLWEDKNVGWGIILEGSK